MTNDEVRQILIDNNLEGSSYFVNPNFGEAIIGSTEEGQIVYEFDLMLESLVQNSGLSYNEASDYIGSYVLRGISAMPEPKPIVIFPLL